MAAEKDTPESLILRLKELEKKAKNISNNLADVRHEFGEIQRKFEDALADARAGADETKAIRGALIKDVYPLLKSMAEEHLNLKLAIPLRRASDPGPVTSESSASTREARRQSSDNTISPTFPRAQSKWSKFMEKMGDAADVLKDKANLSQKISNRNAVKNFKLDDIVEKEDWELEDDNVSAKSPDPARGRANAMSKGSAEPPKFGRK